MLDTSVNCDRSVAPNVSSSVIPPAPTAARRWPPQVARASSMNLSSSWTLAAVQLPAAARDIEPLSSVWTRDGGRAAALLSIGHTAVRKLEIIQDVHMPSSARSTQRQGSRRLTYWYPSAPQRKPMSTSISIRLHQRSRRPAELRRSNMNHCQGSRIAGSAC